MKGLERCIRDLNRRRASMLASEYQNTLNKLMQIQAAENAHDLKLAMIKASRSDDIRREIVRLVRDAFAGRA